MSWAALYVGIVLGAKRGRWAPVEAADFGARLDTFRNDLWLKVRTVGQDDVLWSEASELRGWDMRLLFAALMIVGWHSAASAADDLASTNVQLVNLCLAEDATEKIACSYLMIGVMTTVTTFIQEGPDRQALIGAVGHQILAADNSAQSYQNIWPPPGAMADFLCGTVHALAPQRLFRAEATPP